MSPNRGSSTPPAKPTVGFLGLGLMGEPMATNLLARGFEVVVWNRSEPATERLRRAGARRADTALAALAQCPVTIEMLASEAVIQAVLDPGGDAFAEAIRGRGLIHMSTTAPAYSAELGSRVQAAGGWYVEAPVSGSRTPAQQGALVAMVAGDPDRIDSVTPVLQAMCRLVLRCGTPPAATTMKLAVNTYLVSVVTALAEAWHFADRQGLDLAVFADAIRSGQMCSPIAAVKLDKLLTGDFAAQAALWDVLKNSQLITDAARGASIHLPLLSAGHALLADAVAAGLGDQDMVGVVQALPLREAAAG